MGKSLFMERLRPQLLLAIVAILGLGLGAVYGASVLQANPTATIKHSIDFEVALPPDLDKFVQDAEVIVIGKVGPIVQQGSFTGYQEGKAQITPLEDGQLSSALPITDYQIEVEKVILDDGTISSGKPLVLRVIQGPSDKDEYAGKHRLFFLSLNPDNATYGVHYGSRSQIVMDGPVVTDGDGRELPFASKLNPNQFLDRVKSSIAKVKGVNGE